MIIGMYVFFGFSVMIAAITSTASFAFYKKSKNLPEPEPGTVVIRKNPVMFVATMFIAVWACCFMLVALAFKDTSEVAAVAVAAFFFCVQIVCSYAMKNLINWEVRLKDKGLVFRDMQRHVFEIPYEGLEYKSGLFGDTFYSQGRRIFGAGFVTEGIKALKAVTKSEVKELKPVLEKLAAESAKDVHVKINREVEWQITSASAYDLELHKNLIEAVRNAGRKNVSYIAELTNGKNDSGVLSAIAETLAEWENGEIQASLIYVLAKSCDPAYAFAVAKAVLKRGKEDTLKFGAIYEDALLKTWNVNLFSEYVKLFDSSERLAALGKVAARLTENRAFGITSILSSFVEKFVGYEAGAFDETDETACVNAMKALAAGTYDEDVKRLLEGASYQTRSEKVYTAARELYFTYVPPNMA